VIRIAVWAHASLVHFIATGAAAIALLFLAFLGALFSTRCAWRRRTAWAATLRSGLGLPVCAGVGSGTDDAVTEAGEAVAAREVFGPLARYGQLQRPLPKRIPGRPTERTVTVSATEYTRLMMCDVELTLYQATARRALDALDRDSNSPCEDTDD
jgi:hypothetical protein